MRSKRCVAAIAAQAIGYGLLSYGVLGDGQISRDDLRSVGIGTVLAGIVWFFASRGNAYQERMYEKYRQTGYDAGYADGRRVARPAIVHLPGNEGLIDRRIDGSVKIRHKVPIPVHRGSDRLVTKPARDRG